ncbi:transcription factor HES-5 [Ictalurus punctatus]|uniref:Transcription factor HES-5 n=1 Tax=Ictalurus punctatus TaxID=7998 RepID=A0A2D0PJG2_ICTPU|nr:transcription factor HES-5 [Ictalurus punctatus]
MQPICTNVDLARARTENKLRKIQAEKTRRDRINSSIEQLRMIFCPIMQITEEQAVKLEKADILEMAVTLLRQKAGLRANSSFARGFSQCLHEMLRHVSLHAPLPPKDREEIKRFYVLQRMSLRLGLMLLTQNHLSHRSPKRTASRNRVALWRPWKKN